MPAATALAFAIQARTAVIGIGRDAQLGPASSTNSRSACSSSEMIAPAPSNSPVLGPSDAAGLRAVKATYDPSDVIRSNHPIPPAA